MVPSTILLISVVLYVLAAFFALRLIKTTGKSLPWALIAGGLVLLAGQRALPLFAAFGTLETQAPNLAQALVSLVISLLLVAGVALVAPLLHAFRRNEQLRDVLNERTTIIQEHHEEHLRSLRQMHIALEVGKPVNVIIAQVNTLTHAVQGFLEEMKSGLMVGNNFGVALQSLIEEMSQGNRLPIQLEIDSEVAAHLTKEQSVQLMHIAREAVSNSQRHAHAKKGRVSLKRTQQAVTLEITDNGKGFEMDLVEAQGNGLGNMVARARKIGARLKINSKTKRGTRIYVELPLHHAPVEAQPA